ncbi:MAG: sodium:proton antiporter [Solirubrobacterales bacterium]
MTFLFALTVGVLFGCGALLVLQPDLFRVVVGLAMISNSAVLTLLAVGQTRGKAPIHPLTGDGAVSDPLVQALALTAIVIGFGVLALLLTLVYRVHATHQTVDLDRLARIEADQEHELERGVQEHEELGRALEQEPT